MSDLTRVVKLKGFKVLQPGKIHLICPGCGRKQSNMDRADYDPVDAVAVEIYCENCSLGSKCGMGDYLDENGDSVEWKWLEEE